MFVRVFLEVLVLLVVMTLAAVVMGGYMARVFAGERVWLSVLFRPLEKWLYRLFGVDEGLGMEGRVYLKCLLMFNLLGIVGLFILQEVQGVLPLNPEKMGGLRWDTAMNVAVSFVTNTNWQVYSGERVMSYFTQMFGLGVQNFLSAAVGMSVAVAFIRAFTKKEVKEIGNFWVDLTRGVVYVLLPLSFVMAIVLMTQGVIQNFNSYVEVSTLEGGVQRIAQGPAASQVAIKHLGTNGGGFFNANSAHPYENPTVLTNYLEIFGLLLIPAAFPFAFGVLIGSRRQGWVLYCALLVLFMMGLLISIWAESRGNPLLREMGVMDGRNMEGKEVRVGVVDSVVFSQATTATACGAVNNMHDSLMPLTGMVLMFNMMVGEVIFGGVGVGLVGILGYAILAMFLVGLMIGRTPEIFGKKLESYEMVMTVCLLLLPSLAQLILGATAISTKAGLAGVSEAGPHGLSQIVYAFASGAGNNGSAFGGLGADTVFYNITMGIVMLVGRFAVIVPAIAIAGSLASKKQLPQSARFPTESLLFGGLLIFVVIIVGVLTFFPLLVLGPFLEHLLSKPMSFAF